MVKAEIKDAANHTQEFIEKIWSYNDKTDDFLHRKYKDGNLRVEER
ncbi:hypothetical protein [Salibacterium salarium]|nr:hypothetical protein [Salibacterium salarium]